MRAQPGRRDKRTELTWAWAFICGGCVCNREIDREQVLGKLYIIPFMLVEAEREDYRRNYYSLMREAMIMKDVKGWEVRFRSASPLFPFLSGSVG